MFNIKKTNHIALTYHFIKEHVEDGNVEVHFVGSTDQLADVFTKALPEISFNRILQGLGMIEKKIYSEVKFMKKMIIVYFR